MEEIYDQLAGPSFFQGLAPSEGGTSGQAASTRHMKPTVRASPGTTRLIRLPALLRALPVVSTIVIKASPSALPFYANGQFALNGRFQRRRFTEHTGLSTRSPQKLWATRTASAILYQVIGVERLPTRVGLGARRPVCPRSAGAWRRWGVTLHCPLSPTAVHCRATQLGKMNPTGALAGRFDSTR